MTRFGRLTAVFLLLQSTGCILVPALDSVRNIGVTKEDRSRLLPAEVKRFQDALYWGNQAVALSYVTAESLPTFRSELRSVKKSEKVIGSTIGAIDFDEDARSADVTVTVKRYDQSDLIVREKDERQRWVFAISDGWRIAERRPAPAE